MPNKFLTYKTGGDLGKIRDINNYLPAKHKIPKVIFFLLLLMASQKLFATATEYFYWESPMLNVELVGNYGGEWLIEGIARDLARAITTSNTVARYLQRLNTRGVYKGDPPIKLFISYMKSSMEYSKENDEILISLPILPRNKNVEVLNIVDQALGLGMKHHKITKISYGWVYTLQIAAYNSEKLLKKYWTIHFQNSLSKRDTCLWFVGMHGGKTFPANQYAWWFAEERGFWHVRYGLYATWTEAYKKLVKLKEITNIEGIVLRQRPNGILFRNYFQNKIL